MNYCSIQNEFLYHTGAVYIKCDFSFKIIYFNNAFLNCLKISEDIDINKSIIFLNQFIDTSSFNVLTALLNNNSNSILNTFSTQVQLKIHNSNNKEHIVFFISD